jgi:ribonuclease HI
MPRVPHDHQEPSTISIPHADGIRARPAREVVLMDIAPIATPTHINTVRVYFDGGYVREKGGAAAAVVVYYEVTRPVVVAMKASKLHQSATSYIAEGNGARLAIVFTRSVVQHNPHVNHVAVIGDNNGVVSILASRIESLKSTPGRSQSWQTWHDIMLEREALDRAITERDTVRPPEIDFHWVARRYNQYADALCTATINDQEVDFSLCTLEPIRETITEPTDEMLRDISADCAVTRPDSLRSMPPALSHMWRQVVNIVLSWHKPEATVLIPRVLLRRDRIDLRHELHRLVNVKQEVERYYSTRQMDHCAIKHLGRTSPKGSAWRWSLE